MIQQPRILVPQIRRTGRQGFSERAVLRRFNRIKHGQITVSTPVSEVSFGEQSSQALSGRIEILDNKTFRKILVGGSIGAAEAYMEGLWDSPNLTHVARVFARNAHALEGLETGTSAIGALNARLTHALRKNTRRGSKRNILAHYDLGNDFFEKMLDSTMTYSAAIFEPRSLSLREASIEKIDRLCRKLQLRQNDHLLEIGTGWGSLALHAASKYGCRVTSTTISDAQFGYARERVRRAKLQDHIQVLRKDYRDLSGTYSKLVSVEMIEAVGHDHLDDFFSTINERLLPGGLAAIQAITIRDQLFEAHCRKSDFIKHYIFPGSCIPSVTALCKAATSRNQLRLRDLEDITPHYARTLAEWRENLAPYKEYVLARYGRKFWRMWHYYLCYCEAGFAEDYLGSAQLIYEKPRFS